MVRCLLVCLLFFSGNRFVFSQVGIGTNVPDPSALLDLSSGNKGLLPPRMTWAQIKAIPNPAEGLVVYDMNLHSIRMYDGKKWVAISKQEALSDAPGNFLEMTTDSSSLSEIFSMKIGPDKSLYVVGGFLGTLTIKGVHLTSLGKQDIFFGKYDSSGNLRMLKHIGSSGSDYGFALTIDNAGNIYIGGCFSDTMDFDPGPAIQNLLSAGDIDGFYAKYDNRGNLVWCKSVGGTGPDEVHFIVTDGINLFLGGYFQNTASFNPTVLTSAGYHDIFIAKYQVSTGNFPGWCFGIGGPSSDLITGLELYSAGVLISGYFSSTCRLGLFTILTSFGSSDSFIATYNSFEALSSSFQIGGTADDVINRVSSDATGNIYCAGGFYGTCDFDPGPATRFSTATLLDAFILKLDNTGTFDWVKIFGAAGYEFVNAMVLDDAGNIYLCGLFSGTSTFDAFTFTSVKNDVFVLKLNKFGSIQWVQTAGSVDYDGVDDITVSNDGTVLYISTFMYDPFIGFNKSKYNYQGFYLAKYEE